MVAVAILFWAGGGLGTSICPFPPLLLLFLMLEDLLHQALSSPLCINWFLGSVLLTFAQLTCQMWVLDFSTFYLSHIYVLYVYMYMYICNTALTFRSLSSYAHWIQKLCGQQGCSHLVILAGTCFSSSVTEVMSQICAQIDENRKTTWWLPAHKDKSCIDRPHSAWKWWCNRRNATHARSMLCPVLLGLC